MKILNTKKYFIILWVVLSAMLFSAVGMTVSAVVKNTQSKDLSSYPAEVSAWLGGGTEGNPWEISSAADLLQLEKAVNDDAQEYQWKYFQLTADIDYDGRSIGIGRVDTDTHRVFKGYFDGNGHTISNFKLAGGDYSLDKHNARNYCSYGLFRKISSSTKIYNLRISNVSDSFTCDIKSTKTSGIIAGYADGGTITNCSVENVFINTTKNSDSYDGRTNISLGCIFGTGWANVSNCYVYNITAGQMGSVMAVGPAKHCSYTTSTPSMGAGTYTYHSIYNVSAFTISNCVLRNIYHNTTGVNSVSIETYISGVKSPGLDVTSDYPVTLKNCHTTAKTTTGLICSSVGGNYNKKGTDGTCTPWYYGAEGYNNGYPYLRMFIKSWKPVYFGGETENALTIWLGTESWDVSGSDPYRYQTGDYNIGNIMGEFYVPEIVTYVYPTTTSRDIVLFGRKISVSSKNEGRYRFAEWKCVYPSSATSWSHSTYQATHEEVKFTLTFNICDNARLEKNTFTQTSNIFLTLFADEVITIEYTNLNKEGTYSTITFTITDPVENTTRTVVYTANALYCLTGQDLTIETEITLSENKTVTVTCIEKTYTPNFG